MLIKTDIFKDLYLTQKWYIFVGTFDKTVKKRFLNTHKECDNMSLIYSKTFKFQAMFLK